MPLLDDLQKARSNLWKAQERFDYFPDLNVDVNGFRFNMRDCDIWWRAPLPEPYLKCTMHPDHLRKLLDREMHWNNCEVACLIEFNRWPNNYLPDVHTLMSFFHLPGARP